MDKIWAGQFRDRVVIVTGASRGIGAATARLFADAGAHVVLAARDAAALAALRAEHHAGYGQMVDCPTDVTDDKQVDRLVERTITEFGRLDVAVNNAAAHGARPTPLLNLAADQFDQTIAVSLRSVFVGMQRQIAAMIPTAGGSIVNVSSTAGVQAVAGLADYVAAKHAVIGLTRAAALDHAADGIRVNAVLPGPILTEGLERAGEDAQAMVARSLPVGRLGTAAEVAAAIAWLCLPAADFITGASIAVDGGRLAGTPPFGDLARSR